MFCDCQHTTKNYEPIWRPDDGSKPIPSRPDNAPNIYRPDILQNIEETLRDLDGELRELSLDVHAHPEIAYEERYTHDVLTKFMEKHGFEVTNHYHLETAWRATFTNREGGRTIGVNSEMDALPGVGHACGHNLIAISGVGVSIAIKKALEKFNLPGTVELLGTPAEEVGSGKVVLLDKGAYQNMDACLMCHPAPGPVGSVSLSGSLALEKITVEFTGHTAHAALSPWEGRNAHDAAVLSYNNVSALRQQLLPSHRIHGIFEGKDCTPNIIPDYSKMNYYVRAPTRSEVKATMKRVIPCFEAAALATGCKVKVTTSPGPLDLRQNSVLGGEVANITTARYGDIDYEWGIKNASTDFGDVCY
ncbi:Peptidase M20 domain-containing protein 2, partial [Termitomyces sp. T112]